MQIRLSDHFTYSRLLRFTLPSVVTMIVASIYSVVDGLFVSNLVGAMALSAINIAFPVAMIIGAVGFMLGTGGSALVAKTLGEGKKELANQYFSMLIYSIIGIGAVLTVIILIFVRPIMRLAGASDLLMESSVTYGTILISGSVPFMLQVSFQNFFVVNEKPVLGLVLSIASGVTNMVLDYVFIAVLKMGVAGAGLATVMGYVVGGAIPLLYFAKKREHGLQLTRTRFYGKQLLQAASNGSSELLSNISASLISILYNIQLMKVIGEMGVAAYSVMMYVDFVFLAVFLGFSSGSAPVVSYQYGAGNHKELKSVFRKSITIIGITSVIMVVVSEAISYPLSAVFVGYDKELLNMTVHGFRIFALGYLLSGINIYASSFFTALCNGPLSAFLSFTRTLIFRGGMVLLLPAVLGMDGIWGAIVVAEGLGMVCSLICFVKNRKKYHY